MKPKRIFGMAVLLCSSLHAQSTVIDRSGETMNVDKGFSGVAPGVSMSGHTGVQEKPLSLPLAVTPPEVIRGKSDTLVFKMQITNVGLQTFLLPVSLHEAKVLGDECEKRVELVFSLMPDDVHAPFPQTVFRSLTGSECEAQSLYPLKPNETISLLVSGPPKLNPKLREQAVHLSLQVLVYHDHRHLVRGITPPVNSPSFSASELVRK